MARKKSKSGNQAALDGLRVELIKVTNENSNADTRRNMVQQLIGLMVLNLHKRGRPKKNDEREFSYAI